MSEQMIKDCESRMDKAVDALNRELAKLRAGRANPAYSIEYWLNIMGQKRL